MKIKTYKSDSVSRALAQIKKELGPGAIILNTKKGVNKRFFGLLPTLSYEITAAADSGKTPVKDKKATPSLLKVSSRPASERYETAPVLERDRPLATSREVSDESEARCKPRESHGLWIKQIEQLSSEVAELRNLLQSPARPISAVLQNQILSEPFQRLLWQEGEDEFDSDRVAMVSAEFQKLVNLGLDENLAFFLNRGALKNLTSGQDAEAQLRTQLNDAISGMVQIAPINQTNGNGIVSVFVGPTGVGKTTTIAKLAARFTLNDQKRVRLLTLDTYRIAAAEQLKIYGEIIGVPVRVICSVDELVDVLSQREPNDYVLVDTAGHSHKKISEYAQLAEYLSGQESVQKHLVLSATTNAKDLQEAIDSFNLFSPDGLVFTKLDESSSYGTIVNELIRTKKPLSCLTNGQNVPDDLIIPNSHTVANMMVPVN